MRQPNALRQRIASGQVVVGAIVQMPCAEIVEAFAYAGFDYVIVDLEHGPLTIETAQHMFRAAGAAGIVPLCRPRENAPTLIMQALDAGAHGVVLPGVDTPEDARRAVAAAKYTPQGERGFCSAVRAAHFLAPADYLETSNRETMVIPIIESRRGVEHFEGILATPGIDLVIVGPGDLSHSLGVPGQWDHPLMRQAIERMIRTARGQGKWVGMHCKTPATARAFLEQGVHLLNYGIDIQLVLVALQEIRETLRRLQPVA